VIDGLDLDRQAQAGVRRFGPTIAGHAADHCNTSKGLWKKGHRAAGAGGEPWPAIAAR
jgi:hypothetical protein